MTEFSLRISFPPVLTRTSAGSAVSEWKRHGRGRQQERGSVLKNARALIDSRVRNEVWLSLRIWIPEGNRCCPNHIVDGHLDERSREVLFRRARHGATLTPTDTSRLLFMATSEACRPPLDLGSCKLVDGDYKLLFGISHNQFVHLLSTIQKTGQLRDSSNRGDSSKLKLGISQEVMGVLFGISQPKVSSTFWRVSELLEKYFIPGFLGYQPGTREYAESQFGVCETTV